MKSLIATLIIICSSAVAAGAANSIEECMVHAKALQNPSALTGAAEVCMQNYFDVLSAEADDCRAEAAEKTLSGPELAACQADLILGLRDQLEMCTDEAEKLGETGNELAVQVGVGANQGCDRLRQQSEKICRDNAAKFSSSIAQSTAEGACKAAGL